MKLQHLIHRGTAFTFGLVFAAWIAATLPLQASAETKNYNTEIRYLYVQPGQTLHNIVRRLYPARKTEWPRLKTDIVRLNPHAFTNNDATRMRAGVRLTLPTRSVVKPTSAYPRSLRQVGEVVATRGSAIAVSRDRVSRKLSAGNAVYLGDKLITGEDGFMRLRMIDNALLDLRCFSIMVIEEYSLQTTTRRSVLNILQGSLRKVTGEIGKWKDDIYELKTPMASVGVRGTEYALRVFQSKGCDGSVDTGDNGLYLKVIKGLVEVYNDAAETSVAKGDTVYVPLPGQKPVAKDIAVDVIVVEPDAAGEDDDDSSIWWWLLGAVALIAVF
jgi:hypothetical protein